MAGQAALAGIETWPADMRADLEANRFSGIIGTTLVSETETMRTWHVRVPPGTRCPFHRHVNSYFWTAINPGRSRAYSEDGQITETEYISAQTKHLTFGKGEYMVHCLENIGETELIFASVEFLDGPNAPLPLPDSAWPKPGA